MRDASSWPFRPSPGPVIAEPRIRHVVLPRPYLLGDSLRSTPSTPTVIRSRGVILDLFFVGTFRPRDKISGVGYHRWEVTSTAPVTSDVEPDSPFKSIKSSTVRLPRVRFTVRQLMVAVAAIAVLLTAGIVGQRWMDFSRRARSHADQAWGYSLEAGNSYQLAYDDIRSGNGGSARQSAEEGATWRGLALYHDTLRRKYERAMWRPWALVAPDPPAP
jgi:hypothetical protein